MDEERLSLLFEFLQEDKEYKEISKELKYQSRDELISISCGMDDVVNLIKNQIDSKNPSKKGKEIGNLSATEIASTVVTINEKIKGKIDSSSLSTGNNSIIGHLSSIAFYTEYMAITVDELKSSISSSGLNSAITAGGITEILKLLSSSKFGGIVAPIIAGNNNNNSPVNGGEVVKPRKKKEVIEQQDEKGEINEVTLKKLTLFGGSVKTIISNIMSVNKTYVRKMTIFTRSLSFMMSAFQKNFSGDEAQKVMISANTFTNFLKNYVSTISSIDTKLLSKSKINKVLSTFELFQQIKTSEKEIEKAVKIGEAMVVFANTLNAFLKVIRKAKVPSKSQMMKISTTIRDFIINISETLKKSNIKKAGELVDILDSIGKGVLKFAKRMFWAGPIMILATPGIIAFKLVMKFLMPQFNYLAKNGLKIREGAKAMQSLGWGVLLFSSSVFLASKLFTKMPIAEAVIGITAILGVGWLFTKFFVMIGKKKSDVFSGLKTIAIMSLSILTMVGALYLMSIAPLSYKNIGQTVLCIAGLSALFVLLGTRKVAQNIVRGAGAIALMGLSLMLLSFPIMMFAATLSANSKVLWQIPLLIGGLGLVFGILGKFFMPIMKGAGSVALMGLSLMLLASPLKTIAKTLHDNGDVLWKLPVFLFGMGVVYALAGVGIAFIAPGALAVALIGLSLFTLYKPLEKIAPVLKANGDVLWKLPTLLVGMGLAYAGMGAVSPLIIAGSIAAGALGLSLGFIATPLAKIAKANIKKEQVLGFADSLACVTEGYIKSLKKLSLFDIPKVMVMNLIASSLENFADGIKSWKGVIEKWTDTDTIVMSNLITGATSAMIIGTSPDFIKKTYGIEVTQKDMKRGIKSTMDLGKNLGRLADGVKKWRDMKLTATDAKMITDNIALILSVLPYSIAKIGKLYDDTDGIMNLWGIFEKKENDADKKRKIQYMNGEIFSMSEMKNGMKFTKQLGDVMVSLADGVKKWMEAKITIDDTKLINDNIDLILQTLPACVAKVGKFYDEDNDDASSRLKYVNGDSYTRKELKAGLKYSKDIGGVLESLAKGVKYWKETKITPTDVKIITDNVKMILTTIPQIISQVGKDDGEVKNVGFLGLWSKTDAQRGIDYTIGIGKTLSGLADGVKYWAEAKLTEPQIKAIEKNVSSIIKAIPSVFAEVGRSKDTDKGFWGMFKSDAEKGIKVVEKLTKPFGDMSKIIIGFNSIQNPSERAKLIGVGVKAMLKDTIEGFLLLTPQKIELFDKFIDPFKRFTDILVKFTKEIKEIGQINWKDYEPILEKASQYDSNKIAAAAANRTSSAIGAKPMVASAGKQGAKPAAGAKPVAGKPRAKHETEKDTTNMQLVTTMNQLLQKVGSLEGAINRINAKLAVAPGGGLKVSMS